MTRLTLKGWKFALMGVSALTLMSCGGADKTSSTLPEKLPAANDPLTPAGTNAQPDETPPLPGTSASNSMQPKPLTGPEAQGLIPNPAAGSLTPIIMNTTRLSGSSLRSPAISPDGKRVTVLRAGESGQQDLWSYDLESGQATPLVKTTDILGEPEVLSEEEKNRRERAREYGSGIISYTWIDDNTLMFPLGGDIYLYNLETGEPVRVTETEGFETDPKVSASGRYVTYTRGDELYVKDLTTDKERKLTSGATETVRNATASFVVQEELARNTGYWVSPAEDYIAYSQIDESDIAIENRLDFGADVVTNIAQRYPFAGTANASVKLGVTKLAGGKTRWLNISDDPDIYLARVYWSKDGKTLYVGILSRDNKTFTLSKFDPASGEKTKLFTETSDTWINIRPSFRALDDGGFLWTSERSGFKHIYRYDADGEATQITSGDWPVSSVSCVNPDKNEIYFSGWQDSPLNRHVFKVPMDGGEVTQITQGDGTHSARFSKDCSAYIGYFSDVNTPTKTRAYQSGGTPLTWLNENVVDDNHPYAPYLASHVTPEFGQVKTADGTELNYYLLKPPGLKAGEKRPAVVLVYGGPGVQRVANNFGVTQFGQMLVDYGFVVFQVDNRGSSNRGKAFEDPIYRSMGQIEVKDQVEGIKWLKEQPYVNLDRVGIYGWSYGGYMTLHMLAQTDELRSGVSGAPVTDWTLYDTAYTERYLGNPNPESPNYTQGAYEDGSVFTYLDGLTEPVLLIHGMADDNVVFRHSIKLMATMQKANQHNLEIMTYPGEKHGFRDTKNKIHKDRQIIDFFLRTLGE